LLVDFIAFSPSTIKTVKDKLQTSNSGQFSYEMSGAQPFSQNFSGSPGSGDPGGPPPPAPLPRPSPEIDRSPANLSANNSSVISSSVNLKNGKVSSKIPQKIEDISQDDKSGDSGEVRPNKAVNVECHVKNRPENKNRTEESIFGSSPVSPSGDTINRNSVAISGTSATGVLEEPEKKLSNQRVKGKPKSSSNLLFIDYLNPQVEDDLLGGTLQLIYEFTEERPLSLKLLEKGGVSILLKNQSSKLKVQTMLHEKLIGKIKPLNFMESKKLFEISATLPNDVDAAEVAKEIGAIKHLLRKNKTVIFFMDSKDKVEKLLKSGYTKKPYLLTFELFVFSPILCCRNCGSRKHKSCDAKICTQCGRSLPHNTTTCTPKCAFCEGMHAFSKCPLYKERIVEAKSKKKATYAEALGRNAVSIPPTAVAPERPTTRSLAKQYPDLVRQTIMQTLYSAKCTNLLNENFVVSVVTQVMGYGPQSDLPDTDEEVPTSEEESQEVLNLIQKKAERNPSTPKKKVTFAADVVKSKEPRYVEAINASRKRREEEKDMELAHDLLPNTNEELNEEDIIYTQSKKKITSAARTAIDVRETAKAYCSCGIEFKANPGWKNHLTQSSKCSLDPSVKCGCGLMVLTAKNWNKTYSRFVQHLRSGNCTIAE
jgi:hypothetical protein